MKQEKTAMREVKGGYVQRVWMGDCWRWHSFDEEGRRLPFTAATREDAEAKARAMSLPSVFRVEERG